MLTAVAVQPRVDLAYPDAGKLDSVAIMSNVDASITRVKKAVSEFSAGFVAFPEFFLTGYTLGVDAEGWVNASISIPGPETDKLSKVAVDEKVFIAGTAYEKIDTFPGRFFNTSFVIDTKGDLVLVYRKLYAMTSKTRPIDVLDEFIEKFGEDSLFPVADTSIGRIGAMIARDAHWPELARCLALKGAEILYTPNAAEEEPDNGGIHARRSRAYENHCYVISPNIGPMTINGVDQTGNGRAPTEIIDYHGKVMSGVKGFDEFLVSGEINIKALREFRISGNPKGNFLAQLQSQLHAPIYEKANLFPSNGWEKIPISCGTENKALEMDIIKQMLQNGVLAAPQ